MRIALLLVVGGVMECHAQVRVCPSLEFTDRERIAIELRMRDRLRATEPAPAAEQPASLDGAIPVAFHVLHDGEAGRVSQSQIDRQIDVLNEAFAPARFVLAHVDYTDHPRWFRMKIFSPAEWECKLSLALDPQYYLNVYTCDPGPRLLGWGIFPFLAEYVPPLDGATILYASLPGGDEPGYDEGDSLVHEVGHWAGLFHTFQGICGPWGDLVADTPAQQTPGYGCEIGRDTCPNPGLDPIHNFMDYSFDECATHFTPGQFRRMAQSLAAFRPVIWDLLMHGP